MHFILFTLLTLYANLKRLFATRQTKYRKEGLMPHKSITPEDAKFVELVEEELLPPEAMAKGIIVKELYYDREEVEKMCGGLPLSTPTSRWRLLRKLNGPSSVEAAWDNKNDQLVITITGKKQRVIDDAYENLALRFAKTWRAVHST